MVALVSQVVNSVADSSHELYRKANIEMFTDAANGLLPGPYFEKNKRVD